MHVYKRKQWGEVNIFYKCDLDIIVQFGTGRFFGSGAETLQICLFLQH